MKKKNILERERMFRVSVDAYRTIYGDEMIDDFCDYWTECNKKLSKMRFEYERTWSLERRLKTWLRNELVWRKNGSERQANFRRQSEGNINGRQEREQSIAARIARLAEEDGGGM